MGKGARGGWVPKASLARASPSSLWSSGTTMPRGPVNTQPCNQHPCFPGRYWKDRSHSARGLHKLNLEKPSHCSPQRNVKQLHPRSPGDRILPNLPTPTPDWAHPVLVRETGHAVLEVTSRVELSGKLVGPASFCPDHSQSFPSPARRSHLPSELGQATPTQLTLHPTVLSPAQLPPHPAETHTQVLPTGLQGLVGGG